MQAFLVAGSGAALAIALCFLSMGASIMVRLEKPKKGKAYTFFIISIFMLAFYMFLWQLALGHINLASTSINTVEPVNISPVWLSAVGTTLLAIMTFIIAIVMPRWKKPKFKVEFDNVAPFCMKNNETTPQSYYLRLKVTNSGKSVAKSCSGKLVKFMGDSVEITDYEPVKLHWVGTLWGDMFYFKTIDLNRGEYDFLDVLVTRADSKSRAFLFTPALFSDKPKELPSGTRRIQITIYGDDVEPCTKEYSISWEGSDYTDIRLKEE